MATVRNDLMASYKKLVMIERAKAELTHDHQKERRYAEMVKVLEDESIPLSAIETDPEKALQAYRQHRAVFGPANMLGDNAGTLQRWKTEAKDLSAQTKQLQNELKKSMLNQFAVGLDIAGDTASEHTAHFSPPPQRGRKHEHLPHFLPPSHADDDKGPGQRRRRHRNVPHFMPPNSLRKHTGSSTKGSDGTEHHSRIYDIWKAMFGSVSSKPLSDAAGRR